MSETENPGATFPRDDQVASGALPKESNAKCACVQVTGVCVCVWSHVSDSTHKNSYFSLSSDKKQHL